MTKSKQTIETDSAGTRRWSLKGKRHRTDGTAVEYADGSTEWWVNGQQISTPYTYVLSAAFNRGLPIPPEVLPEVGLQQSDLAQ